MHFFYKALIYSALQGQNFYTYIIENLRPTLLCIVPCITR